MTRRRTLTPSFSRDWRALAAPPAQQRGLALPVRTSADAAPDVIAELDDVKLRVRRGDDGARVVLVAAVVFRDTGEARRLAARLCEAADAADALGNST